MSSCHGIPNIIRSKSWFVRLTWLFFFMFCLCWAVYTTIGMTLSYADFNVLIQYEQKQEFGSLIFPSIAICNLNPFDFSNKSNLDKVFKYYNSTYDADSYYFINDNNSLCTNDPKEAVVAGHSSFESISQYSYSLEKMLINCLYNNEPCNASNFRTRTSGQFGKCYLFNTDGMATVKRAGMNNGLQLEMFIGENEYQPCWIAARGLLVVIYNKDQRPAYVEDGIKMEPGQENNLVLTKYEYQKLSFPYSDCIEDSRMSKRNEHVSYTIQQEGAYTQKRCIRFCAMNKNTAFNEKICKDSNNYSAECLKSTQNLTDFYEICAPECPLECKYSVFNVVPTYLEYPSRNYAEQLTKIKKFTDKFTYTGGENLTFERVLENVLKVNIYFGWVNVNYYYDEPEMDFNQFLSNIGGQLGLFLGISLLSIFEVIDFVYLFFEVFVFKVTTAAKTAKSDQINT